MRGFILALLLVIPMYCLPQDVVVNAESNLPKVVSAEELRDYFMLKKGFFPSGVKVQVYLFSKDNTATRNFLLNVLKISPSAYFDMVDSYTSTGRGNLPVIVESDARMVIAIAVNRGGLGIVRDAAYAANLSTIRVIEIK